MNKSFHELLAQIEDYSGCKRDIDGELVNPEAYAKWLIKRNMRNMNNELFIEALNRAIRIYKHDSHEPMWGDVVVDYNPYRCKIASYLTRHPGCIMLPVKLEEGTGFVFLKSTTKLLRGNTVQLCWESDNIFHELYGLFRSDIENNEITQEQYGELATDIDNLITEHLFQ